MAWDLLQEACSPTRTAALVFQAAEIVYYLMHAMLVVTVLPQFSWGFPFHFAAANVTMLFAAAWMVLQLTWGWITRRSVQPTLITRFDPGPAVAMPAAGDQCSPATSIPLAEGPIVQ